MEHGQRKGLGGGTGPGAPTQAPVRPPPSSNHFMATLNNAQVVGGPSNPDAETVRREKIVHSHELREVAFKEHNTRLAKADEKGKPFYKIFRGRDKLDCLTSYSGCEKALLFVLDVRTHH